MHPNPVFHDADQAANLEFARDRAFGVLAVCEDGAPLISHVPFLLSEDGQSVDLHLVRSNPIARLARLPIKVRLAVSGPDAYISPDWYGIEDQVPTWNYVAVHLVGTLQLLPDSDFRRLLERQSAFYETRLLPKPPWTLDKMSDEALTRMMRMIVPARISVERVEGTWKLSQNKSEAARTGAAGQVPGGIGHELEALTKLMGPER
ncbi:MAG: FMN-binding negative transcriptional regulator [Rhodobacteraceae bacterium]|nr:FMN-binding negative transcriptional regulator [Paracoccaceae bacterium]